MADNIIVTFDYRITNVNLNIKDNMIDIILEKYENGWKGQTIKFTYTGANASNLLQYINTANFSVNSFKKQIIQKLVTDGLISGTVS